MRWAAGIVAVVLIAAGAVVWTLRGERDNALVGVLETDVIDVGSLVGGRVAEVLVEPGQRVATGDVLVRLEPFDTNERLAEAEAELAARQATFETLTAAPRPEALAQAEARRDERKAALNALLAGPNALQHQVAQDEVAVAQAALVEAEGEFDAFKSGTVESPGKLTSMDRVVRRVAAARAALDAKRSRLEAIETGSPLEEIEAARARVDEAEADIALLKAGPTEAALAEAKARIQHADAHAATVRRQASEYAVTAPVDGVVATVGARPGAVLPANATSVTLYHGGAWRFVMPRREKLPPLHEKARVRIRRPADSDKAKDAGEDATPGETTAWIERMHERVRWMDANGEGASPTRVLEMTLMFEGGPPPIPPGNLVELSLAPAKAAESR